jgi:hypothetical protein
MKALILGLWTVHSKGYVYSGALPFAAAGLATNVLQI